MRVNPAWRLIGIGVFPAWLFAWSAGFDLVRDGRAVAEIAVPDRPLPCVQAAAEELVRHVRLISGATLPVVHEKQVSGKGPVVFLGATRAAAAAGLKVPGGIPNAFVIKVVGQKMFFLGDDSDGPVFWILHNNRTRVGTLFAVYEFLERGLGVRWIWPGESGIAAPKQRTISVGPWDLSGRPALVHSRWRDGPAAGVEGWAASAHRSRFLEAQSKWLRRHRFALGINLDVRHSFAGYWAKYGTTHPEFFNRLPDGTRRPDPLYWNGAPQLVSMCVSNPALVRAAVAYYRKHRMNPGRLYVDASENDTPGKCTCPQCMAMDVPAPGAAVRFDRRLEACRKAFAAKDPDWWKALGPVSDRYCKFWLAVQREARKYDPNAVVLFHGYANYVDPPRSVKLNRGFINAFVPRFLFPWSDEAVGRFRRDWLGWVRTGCRMMLRPNYLDCGHDFPIFYARKFAENFNFAWAHGLMATDFDALNGQFATQALNLYTVARLNDHPGMSAQAIFAEFYGAFGPAGEAVRRYFGVWEQVSDALTPERLAAAGRPAGIEGAGAALYADFYLLAPRIFTPAVMGRAERALAEAEKRAAHAPAEVAARVRVLRDGFEEVRATLAAERAYEAYRADGNLRPFAAALQRLDALRARIEGQGLINMYWLRKWEARHWDRTLVRTMARHPGRRLPDPWRFQWDPGGIGEKAGWWKPGFDDSQWLRLRTDAPWEQQAPGRKWAATHGGKDYDGAAWYRTRFRVSKAARGKSVRLLFGAVDEACTVWVNGRRVLERPYPWRGDRDSWEKAFEVEITPAVRFGQENRLAVRVLDQAGAGGIWRPVWVMITELGAPAGVNRIVNGGFENGEKPWKRHVVAGRFVFAIDRNGRARTGAACALVQCTALASPRPAAGNPHRAWGRSYQFIAVQKGRRYRLRAWVKTAPGFAGRVVVFFTGDAARKTRSAALLGTGGLWRRIAIDGYRAAGRQAGVYLNVMDGLGKVWFDDVEVLPEPAH